MVSLDKFLSPAILVTIIMAVVLNPGIFTGIGAAVYNSSEREPQYEVAGAKTSEFESMIDDITLDIPEVQDYDKGTTVESTTEAIAYNTDILQEELQYYIIPDAQTAYYAYGDLEGLSKEELRYARNEIYARRGRKFETADLNEYFSSQPWYTGYLSADEFDESVFNEYEKANMDLIKSVEQSIEQGNASAELVAGLYRDDSSNYPLDFSLSLYSSPYEENGYTVLGSFTITCAQHNTEELLLADTSGNLYLYSGNGEPIGLEVTPNGDIKTYYFRDYVVLKRIETYYGN